jgi:DNA-binding CsgD family transcriptional regulator
MRTRLNRHTKSATSADTETFGGAALNEMRRFRPMPNGSDCRYLTSAFLSCWESLDDRARLVVERDGSLIVCGQCAVQLIESLDCLQFRDGVLKAKTAEANGDLRDVLKTQVGQVAELVMPCKEIDGHCILHATGICATTVAVTIQITHENFVPRFADLESAFSLTPAESRVVELLLGGHGPSEISEELDISVHTVRAHLRHCYEKLGVSSREALWQKLAPYRLN